MKRLPHLALAAALFAGALTGIPSLAFAGNLPAAIDGSVAVMHTNDIHGSYKYSYNASKGTGTVGFDGLAVLYSAQDSAPDLLLDAGDTFHGQSFATMSEGKSIAELMDTFYANGYDATTPGNHDWSYGADKLRTMAGNGATSTPFAMLCANATSSNGVWSSSITKTLNRTWENSEDHSTFDYKIKVGVVGAMDESLSFSLREDLVKGTSFSGAANAINAEAKRLREDEGCNVIVCIAHTLNAKAFATQLASVDALIAGHEHINLNEKVTGADGKPVRVVEAGSAFAEVGLLSIPYEYDTRGTETTNDDMVTVSAGDSDEKLYTAKTSTTFWQTLTTRTSLTRFATTKSSHSTMPLKANRTRCSAHPPPTISTARTPRVRMAGRWCAPPICAPVKRATPPKPRPSGMLSAAPILP